MLPEIALSEQWLERFKKSFGFYPLIWNSKLSYLKKEKFGIWFKKKTLSFSGCKVFLIFTLL